MSEPSSTRGKSARQRRRREGASRQLAAAQATLATPTDALSVAPLAVEVDIAPRLARATEPVAPVADAPVAVIAAPVAPDDAPVAPPIAEVQPEAIRQAFSAWLRQARQAKGMSLEAMAQKTRIQVRVLTCLESAQFDALHADVFVRGYLRSYAQCVGLAATEVLEKYAACGIAPCPVSAPDAQMSGQQLAAPPPTLGARFGTASGQMAAASVTAPVGPASAPTTPAPTAAKPSSAPHVTPAAAAVVAPVAPVVAPIIVVEAMAQEAVALSTARAVNAPAADSRAEVQAQAGKKMPKPHLVIDDANPDLSVRAERKSDWDDDRFTSPFLRGDREPKQSGLTLAVIVLLVAATIALSYLMKTAPSRGVTSRGVAGLLIG